MSKKKRLGIMGGTFDPIHYGHLVAAEMARVEFGLDKVLFIPTGTPPHKQGREISAAEMRFEMVRLAVEDNPYFEASRLEIERGGFSYTVDTLKTLQEKFMDCELYFITGADALREIFTWHEPQKIFSMAYVIGVTRPGFETVDFLNKTWQEHPETSGRIKFFEVPALAISSTDIRARARRGEPVRYLLPESVRSFIEKNQLYRD